MAKIKFECLANGISVSGIFLENGNQCFIDEQSYVTFSDK